MSRRAREEDLRDVVSFVIIPIVLQSDAGVAFRPAIHGGFRARSALLTFVCKDMDSLTPPETGYQRLDMRLGPLTPPETSEPW